MTTLIVTYVICAFAVALYILRMSGLQRQILKRMAAQQLPLQSSAAEKSGD